MIGSKEMLEEDWERCYDADQVYLAEREYERDLEFWEWYSRQEGTIIVETPQGDKVVDITASSYHLPF